MFENIKQNDVISVMTSMGEYIATYVKSNGNSVTLKRPHPVIPTEEGLKFGASMTLTGEANPETVVMNMSHISFVSKPYDQLLDGYKQHVSKVIMPGNGLMV